MYYFGARYYDPRTSVWQSVDPILTEYLDGTKGFGGISNPVNLGLYTYAYQNPVRLTDPNGMWVDGGDGSFTTEKGDTLWGLEKETGRDWRSSDFVGDPKKLQIGQNVSFAVQGPANQGVTIDSTAEAVDHYYGGNGMPAILGPETQKLLRNNPDHMLREQRIRTGATSSLSGNYGVDMTGSMFHVGSTRVDYSTTCGTTSCVTDFSGFTQDGFWDIFWGGDRMGGSGELFGEPYPYVPYNWTISNPNPNLKKRP